MNDIKPNNIEWVHCNQCLRKTRHEILLSKKLKEIEDDPFLYEWVTTYTMLECCGCGNVTLRRNVSATEIDVDDTNYYPPPISRQIPQWHYELPEELKDLLNECYTALQAGSKRLAIMGARTIIDVFMNITLGDIGGFQQKLDGLTKKGYLSEQNRDILETALEAGHAVVHRGHIPKNEDVTIIFDIVENMLQSSVLKSKSEQMKKRTPNRNKSTKP
ncbi:MAG: DUF4145 domain-containing protein [Phycisphaerales bacterium]